MDNTVHSISAKVSGTPQSESRLGPATKTSRVSCASESVCAPFIPCPKDETREPKLTVLDGAQGLSTKSSDESLESLAFDEFFLRGDDPPSASSTSAQNDVEFERESDLQFARTPIQLARRLRYIKFVRAIVASLAVGSAIAVAVSLATKPEPQALFVLAPGPEYSVVGASKSDTTSAMPAVEVAPKSGAASASPAVEVAQKSGATSAMLNVVQGSKSDAPSVSKSAAKTSKTSVPSASNHASTTAKRPTAPALSQWMHDLKKSTTPASGAVAKAKHGSKASTATNTRSLPKPAGYRPPTATFSE